jgi:hypothetical protein
MGRANIPTAVLAAAALGLLLLSEVLCDVIYASAENDAGVWIVMVAAAALAYRCFREARRSSPLGMAGRYIVAGIALYVFASLIMSHFITHPPARHSLKTVSNLSATLALAPASVFAV